MKPATILFVLTLFSAGLTGFTDKDKISSCYLSFDKATGLTRGAIDQLPEHAAKSRMVKTEHGMVEISRTDGYRILYNTVKNATFVNVKVERSQPGSYETDKKRLLENLTYLHQHTQNMEGSGLTQLSYNGYQIWGSSRNTIKEGNTLGTFVMFPGNDITVYFYFNNPEPGLRNFENLEEYKSERNLFIGAYTSHLKSCAAQ